MPGSRDVATAEPSNALSRDAAATTRGAPAEGVRLTALAGLGRAGMAAMLALAVLGCGADQAGVESDDAWARTSPAAVSVGAAYVELTSAETDRLIGVSVDPSVAASVEIHEIVPVSGHMGDTDSGDTNSGETELGDTESSETEMPHQMQEVTGGLELPAGETVVLEPGGYHLMLIDLVEPLEAGSAFELELDFENSDPLTVTFDVRDQ